MPKCEYGCGREAKIQIGKSKKWCCSESYMSCSDIRNRISKSLKDKPLSKAHRNKISKALTGKTQSEETNKKRSDSLKGHIGAYGIKLDSSNKKLCDYGCGKKAKYKFKNGRYCCSKNTNHCSNIKEKNNNKACKIEDESSKELCEYGCGK